MTTTFKKDGATLEAAEHAALHDLMNRVREVFSQQPRSCTSLVDALRRLVDVVLSHFDHETEENGFFDQVIAHRPGVAHQAAELQREHFDLRSQLFALEQRAGRASNIDVDWNDLLDRFVAFERQMLRHELNETDLLQIVYNEDLGRGA
ncbi:MAG: hemerythrin domain-containing protein [Planctomycetaceae bacterium]|nr:hemerythrin domain-containing protein [Planctomycetaceae bacterium]